ncbi:hypothetical protein AN216_07960 [Streptomyces oceani]|uniref:Uncharacterized protein n=1 Tax=Streptomyces oceani TaxID=1075402 RepID=A0A1E7KJQ8_9ACTN|nr:hypothetical protein AN216_07960 [Streptomyces oceani]
MPERGEALIEYAESLLIDLQCRRAGRSIHISRGEAGPELPDVGDRQAGAEQLAQSGDEANGVVAVAAVAVRVTVWGEEAVLLVVPQ